MVEEKKDSKEKSKKEEQEESKKDLEEDTKREFKDTQQEVMFDLKLKTDEVFKKFKELQKKNKVKFGGM